MRKKRPAKKQRPAGSLTIREMAQWAFANGLELHVALTPKCPEPKRQKKTGRRTA